MQTTRPYYANYKTYSFISLGRKTILLDVLVPQPIIFFVDLDALDDNGHGHLGILVGHCMVYFYPKVYCLFSLLKGCCSCNSWVQQHGSQPWSQTCRQGKQTPLWCRPVKQSMPEGASSGTGRAEASGWDVETKYYWAHLWNAVFVLELDLLIQCGIYHIHELTGEFAEWA